MKFIPVQIAYFLQNRATRRNFRMLKKFVYLLCVMMLIFSVLFHVIMLREGQQHSWLTGLYWTLTVMSTLGFGDITFHSDLGRFFSIIVLISGVLFMLVLLPFAFIQFFLAPWLEAQSRARAPRELPPNTKGHILFTCYDTITQNLIRKLKSEDYDYAVIVPDIKYALELYDHGVKVMVGNVDDPDTYRRAHAESAAMVVVTENDMINTSVIFTVREIAPDVTIVTNADTDDAVEILHLAGASNVLELKQKLGRFLARRAIGMNSRVNVVGHLGDLNIAEASATRSPLVGKTLAESRLRELTGVTIVGFWERGQFLLAHPDTPITSATVFVMVGTQEQLDAYDELFCIYVAAQAPTVVIGGGRVGLAAAKALHDREMDYRIIEKNPYLADSQHHIVGSASDFETLQKAGIAKAMSVIITTSDDETNIYLTVFCRKLYPDLQIISRANYERNVSTLHRAGADFVMSFSTMSANTIFNILTNEDLLMFAEGLGVFRSPVPAEVAGKAIKDSAIRENSHCSIVAIERNGHMIPNPQPDTILETGDILVLLGNTDVKKLTKK